jgi:hypothetical protein
MRLRNTPRRRRQRHAASARGTMRAAWPFIAGSGSTEAGSLVARRCLTCLRASMRAVRCPDLTCARCGPMTVTQHSISDLSPGNRQPTGEGGRRVAEFPHSYCVLCIVYCVLCIIVYCVCDGVMECVATRAQPSGRSWQVTWMSIGVLVSINVLVSMTCDSIVGSEGAGGYIVSQSTPMCAVVLRVQCKVYGSG